jgi:hypothetical protein
MDFIGEDEKNVLVLLTGDKYPRLNVAFDMKLKTKGSEKEEIIVHEFIGVKGFKARGKRVSVHAVKKVEFLEPMEVGGQSSEDGEQKTEDGEWRMEDEEVKTEDGGQKAENRGPKTEDGIQKVKASRKKKDVEVQKPELEEEQKKKEEEGDAVQMELPL